MNSLISIIVPIYNVAPYLNKCVKSLTEQSYTNLQILLIDDGSTDGSAELCDQWKKCDSRINVIHKKNGGLSDARNAGLKEAKGEFLSFVDGDDFLSSDALEIMYKAMEQCQGDIAVCNMIRITTESTTEPFYVPCHSLKVLKGLKRFQTLNQPSVCNKLFKAELFQDIWFPYGKLYEDTFIYHELAYRAGTIVLTGCDSYWYLIRRESILGEKPQYTDRYFDFIEAVWKRCLFLLQHQIQPYANQACLSLYAALSNAEKNIPKTSHNKLLFKEAQNSYDLAYRQLMKPRSGISFKQRIRLFLLKYMPHLHSRIYG